MRLVVTTTLRATDVEHARVSRVAALLGAPAVPRPGLDLRRLFDQGGRAYIVTRDRDELRDARRSLTVHAGLLKTRLHPGVSHPLIRALAPDGRASRVVDGTLGLAGDALHVAGALGCEVLGVELSTPLYCLLEEGLARLSREPEPVGACARAIRLRHGDTTEVLAELPADSADAVLLAPMYLTPDRAQPGFGLLREQAVHGQLTGLQIERALRVAPRLVVKWPRGEPPPGDAGLHDKLTRLSGKAVDYWVLTR